MGRKKSGVEHNLGEEVILSLSTRLEGTNCELYFDNFFTSPTLIDILFKNGIYATGNVRTSRKQMPRLPDDKQMARGDYHFEYAENVAAVKWFDNRGVTLLSSNTDGVSAMSSVKRRQKGAATKIQIPCPELVKSYNAYMGGVDLLDQRTAAYRLDRKSTMRSYPRIFFDLMDISMVNAYLAYSKLTHNPMTLLDFKIGVAKSMVGIYCSRQRNAPNNRSNRRDSLQPPPPTTVPQHLPVVMSVRQRCTYCSKEGQENKSKVYCPVCKMYLCLNEKRNCYTKSHYI